ARDAVAGTEEPARQRSLANAERSRRLLVREPGDVDRDERVAEVLGQLGDRREDLVLLDRRRRVVRPPSRRDLLGEGGWSQGDGWPRDTGSRGCCEGRAGGSRARPRREAGEAGRGHV